MSCKSMSPSQPFALNRANGPRAVSVTHDEDAHPIELGALDHFAQIPHHGRRHAAAHDFRFTAVGAQFTDRERAARRPLQHADRDDDDQRDDEIDFHAAQRIVAAESEAR